LIRQGGSFLLRFQVGDSRLFSRVETCKL